MGMGQGSWIWWPILPVVAWFLFTQIRHMAQHYRSAGWPVIDATVRKGPTGFVPISRGEGTPACFIGYCFSVQGSTYTGLFALYGSRDDVEKVHRNLTSGSIRVRYNPANPNVSCLVDLYDPRFERLVPTQNPVHLVNAPLFDLQDLIEH
jgi:hypothetical protein